MTRTYRGPIIERQVESGIVHGSADTSSEFFFRRALAVDDGTGDIVIILPWDSEKWGVSGHNPSGHTCFQSWKVTR